MKKLSSQHPGRERVKQWIRGILPGVLSCLFVPRLLAIDIIPQWDSSVTSNPSANDIETTIRAACFEYKYRIADAVTVNIKFATTNTSLGLSANADDAGYAYPVYRAALVSHATDIFDTLAINSLPVQDANPVNGDTDVVLAGPLARALGLETNQPDLDGTIWQNASSECLSPSGDWNFDLTGCVCHRNYSLFAVICHEIDEVLGFSSVLDGLQNGDPPPTGSIGVEDLWRYQDIFGLTGSRSLSTSASTAAYFFLPGYGAIGRFNQEQGGDFHDWFQDGNQPPHIQDAYGTHFSTERLTSEVAVMDVIGYTVLPTPVWLDPNDSSGYNTLLGRNGDYMSPYESDSDAAANVGYGGTIIYCYSPTVHKSRVDGSTFGKPVRLASFNGTTRIAR